MKKTIALLFIFTIFTYPQVNDANRYMLGQSYVQAGDFSKAKEIFTALYNNNLQNPQYFQALNEVLLQLKEYDESINLLESRIKQAPADINLYGQLGAVYYIKGDEDRAYKTWDDALLKVPPTSVSYRVLANYAIERRAFEKAIDILNKGKAVAEDPNMFAFDLANLYSITMRYKDAAEEYCAVLKNGPNMLNAVESRIYSYTNKPEALQATIEALEECRTGEDISFLYLLGRLYKQQKSFVKAYEYFKEIDKRQNFQGAELYNFAEQLFSEEEYSMASKVFSEIIEDYPSSPFAANAKLSYAKTSEALFLEERKSGSQSWKTYYKTVPAEAEKTGGIVKAYQDLIKSYPHTDIANESLLRIGKVLLYQQDDPAEAEKYYSRIVTEAPLSRFAAEAYLDLSHISLLNNKLDETIAHLKKASGSGSAEQEKRNLARYYLANTYFYTGDFESAKSLLSQIMDNLKDNTANDAIELSMLLNTQMNDSSNLLVFAEAELLAEQKKFNEAEEKYKVVAENPKGFLLNHLAKIRVAEMELAQDNLETSVQLFGTIAAEEEKNIYSDKALYLLGKIFQFGLKDNIKAMEAYESLLAKFPNSLYLDEAREEILKLRNKPS